MEKARAIATMLLAATAFAGTPAMAQQGTESKGATANTERANAAVRQAMTMNDKQDFEDATRGLMAQLKDPIVKAADGRVVWNTQRYEFVKGDPPATVNPSLWREQKLNTAAGLFKVVDGVYQIRGYDMANMTLVEGASGWIVIDTLFTEDVARAGLKLAMETLKSSKPVVAVIYTHSHVDHFGGVRGVVDEADVRSGKVKVIAPEGFMDNAIAENVLAGNAMSRRANYMYGISLPANDKGSVGTGLGMTLSNGAPGLIPPTVIVKKTGEEMTIDGVRIQFQMAQDTEAPSEMMMYLPEKKALCLSEVAVKLMHNVYTIRGAKVRDALVWSKYINETLDLFPDAEVAFASHHWPTWGNANVRQFVANQRDTYRFLHDRALNLANQGETMPELANASFFPKGLAADASSHGYYGTLSHNLRAVYNFYLGYYDANPATLDPLLPDRIGQALRRGDGRRGGGRGAGPQGLCRRRLPLGGRTGQQGGLCQPEQRRGACAAGRRAGTARLPGRVGDLAQRLPDGRARTAQRTEGPGRQLERAGHGARHDQRTAVRLHRAAPEPREDRRHEGGDQHGLQRQQRGLGAGIVELGAEQHQGARAEEPRRDDHTDAASLPGDAAAGQEAARTGAGRHGQGRRQSAELRCGGGQHHELRPGLQHRHTLMAPH